MFQMEVSSKSLLCLSTRGPLWYRCLIGLLCTNSAFWPTILWISLVVPVCPVTEPWSRLLDNKLNSLWHFSYFLDNDTHFVWPDTSQIKPHLKATSCLYLVLSPYIPDSPQFYQIKVLSKEPSGWLLESGVQLLGCNKSLHPHQPFLDKTERPCLKIWSRIPSKSFLSVSYGAGFIQCSWRVMTVSKAKPKDNTFGIWKVTLQKHVLFITLFILDDITLIWLQ